MKFEKREKERGGGEEEEKYWNDIVDVCRPFPISQGTHTGMAIVSVIGAPFVKFKRKKSIPFFSRCLSNENSLLLLLLLL